MTSFRNEAGHFVYKEVIMIDWSKYTDILPYNINKAFSLFEADFGTMDPKNFAEVVDKEDIVVINRYIIAAYHFYYFVKTNKYADPAFEDATAHHVQYSFKDQDGHLHKFWYDTDSDKINITIAYDIWLHKGSFEEVTYRFVNTMNTKFI